MTPAAHTRGLTKDRRRLLRAIDAGRPAPGGLEFWARCLDDGLITVTPNGDGTFRLGITDAGRAALAAATRSGGGE